MKIDSYLLSLEEKLLKKNNWQKVIMTRQWASQIPRAPGVYVFKENGKIVYVGETGNLQGRIYDLLDSRHHSVRRTIGERLFSAKAGFVRATIKIKFPDHIEVLVNDHMCSKLLFACLEVQLGRKELEELIESKISNEVRLNKRGKRK